MAGHREMTTLQPRTAPLPDYMHSGSYETAVRAAPPHGRPPADPLL